MTAPSRLRLALVNLLGQYARTGVKVDSLERSLPSVDRVRILRTLENMKRDELAHSVRTEGTRTRTWFPGAAPSDPSDPILSALDFKRIERARDLDRLKPLRLCGSNLPGGRCPSVWTYANSFIEGSHP